MARLCAKKQQRRGIPGRRGGTWTAVLASIAIFGTFTVAAVVVRPMVIEAGTAPVHEIVEARIPRHQEIIETLGRLIGGSAEVLAVHQRSPGPYLEIILRTRGMAGEDVLPEDHLAVISHSRVMQTLMLRHVSEAAADEKDAGRTIRRSDVLSDSFCDRWRARADVQSRVIGAGISDMRVEVLQGEGEGSRLLQIGLTWAADSADGKDEASILVDVAVAEPFATE